MHEVIKQGSPLSSLAAQPQMVEPNSADVHRQLVSVIDPTISYLDHAFSQTVDKFATACSPVMIIGDKMTIALSHLTS